MSEKMVKIIGVSGLQPRPFTAKNGDIYIFEDYKNNTIDKNGKEAIEYYPVYEIPEDLAKFKLSQMPDRYKLMEAKAPVRFATTTNNGARSWCESIPVKFKMNTKAVIDPNTGKQAVDEKGKELPPIKYYTLVDIKDKKVDAKPYKIELKADNAA